jgi:hypothetical protein
MERELSAVPSDQMRSLAAIRSELGRVRSSIVRIEEDLKALESAFAEGSDPSRRRPDRYLRLLLDVYDRGGRHGVDAEGLAAIGARHGYDRRGLGGFFTGTRAPLRRVDRRVRLSPYGERLIDIYLDEHRR